MFYAPQIEGARNLPEYAAGFAFILLKIIFKYLKEKLT